MPMEFISVYNDAELTRILYLYPRYFSVQIFIVVCYALHTRNSEQNKFNILYSIAFFSKYNCNKISDDIFIGKINKIVFGKNWVFAHNKRN